jgi:hypothetical protein
MLGGPPVDPLGPLAPPWPPPAGGWEAGGGLLHCGATCEALRPRMLEDAWQTSGGHLQDLWRPLGLLLQGVGRRVVSGLLYSVAACEDL